MPDASSDRRGPLTLFLIGFLTFALLYTAQPLLPAFAADFGLHAADSALAMSVSTATLALTIFVFTVRPGRLDRRWLMGLALLAAVGFNALTALSTSWPQLLTCRALLGLVLGAVPATAMAHAGDAVPRERLATTMGLYVAGTATGGMSGRIGIGFLAEALGWRAGLLGLSALGLAVLGLLAWSLSGRRRAPTTPPPDTAEATSAVSPWQAVRQDTRLQRLILCGALASGIFVTAYNYAGFRLMAPPFALDAGQAGLIFSGYLAGVMSSGWSGRWVRRHGSRQVLLWACAVTAVGVLLSLPAQLVLFIPGLALMTAGFFAMHAVCSGWISHAAGRWKAQATGLYLLAYYIGSSLAGYGGGWLWSHGGWLLLCGGLLVGVAAFATLAGSCPDNA
ncbi:MAG: hypothetical protein RL654_291 [Pseudomonadota bacterium]|jgi:YNFM family putative membrane transporter